jgi:RHS repeat-associated protein
LFGLPVLAPVGLSATVTRSKTETTTDVMDLTGDGIPDVIAANQAYQGTLGSTPSPKLDFQFRRTRERIGTQYMISKDLGAATPDITALGRAIMGRAQKEGPHGRFHLGTTRGLAIGRAQTRDDIVDVNGDGLPDVVQRRGNNINVRYNLGYELGAWETIGTVAPELNEAIDKFQKFEEATAVFGEGLNTTAEAITHETTLTQNETFSIGIWIAKGSRTTRKTSSRTTRELADINGDGLPDLLVKRSGQPIQVQYNLGGTFSGATDWQTPSWGTLELSPSFHSKFDALLKVGTYVITGPDVLTASGTEKSKSWSGGIHIKVPDFPAFVDINGSKSTDEDTFELALMDINGDGFPDHVLRRKQSNTVAVYAKPNLITGASNLLERVNRPLGGSITLTYAAQPNTQDMPRVRQVLSSVTVDDGVDLGSQFASPNLVTTFTYEGGFNQRLEKQFFGFERVITHRPDGGTIEQQYNNRNFTMQGLLEREIRRDSGSNVVSQHVNGYQLERVVGPTGPLEPHPACLGALHPLLQRLPSNDACTPMVARLETVADIQGELGTTATKSHVAKNGIADRFGNVLGSQEGDGNLTGENLWVSATYQNDTTRWILGRPTLVEGRAIHPGGTLLRSRSGVYDVRGRLGQVSVNTGNGIATTTLSYDNFGNVARIETPPNANGQTQTYDVTFDPIVATYATSTTDGFGYTSTAAYDLRFGVATSETDINGTALVRTVDEFGRLKSVRGPYDSGAGITLEYYPNESPPRAVSVTRTSAPADYAGPLPSPVTTVTIEDGLGRAVELRKTSVVGGVAGMTTSGLVERDALGRMTKTWHPFFTQGASTGFVTPTGDNPTTLTYDELDRVKVTTQPDGGVETASYTIAPAPNGQTLFRMQHTVYVASGNHVREQYTDSAGRVRAFVEHPTAFTSSVTLYDYLQTGELRSIKDAEGNVTTLGYDLRGQRTTLQNPDIGLRQHVFDLMGNQIALIEPNHRLLNTQVRYTYDRNRLASIDYPSKPDVTYEYGATGAANGRAGRLVRVTDETGSVEYWYGALGEARRVLRTFAPAGSTQPLQFDQRFTYDSLGRQLQLRYPDGELVTNVYDASGGLAEVKGAGDGWERTYASGMQYDVFGNRTRMEVGRVVTTWSYDPARVRLTNVVSALTPPSAAASLIQNLSYAYDAADNPTQITNNLTTPLIAPGAMPRRSSLTLTYDGVDRLTTATGSAQQDRLLSTAYEEYFTYSPSHNIATKTRTHTRFRPPHLEQTPPATNFALTYTYGAHPHLPDQVGSLQLLYDPSGNPTRRADASTGLTQLLTWDDDDRLVQLTDTSGVVQNNLYDASGVRVRRKSTSSTGARTTIFASQYFELEGEQASSQGGIKHIFAGNQRVATVLGAFNSTENPVAPATPGISYYVHGDRLGSTTVVTDDLGTVNQSMEYFIDGEAWIDRSPSQPVNGYLFNGKPYDPETKFYDYGQRFYDPKTSLWLGVDPAFTDNTSTAVGSPIALAVGAFANHNPLAFVDPDGRQAAVIGLRNKDGSVTWSRDPIGELAGRIIRARGKANAKEAKGVVGGEIQTLKDKWDALAGGVAAVLSSASGRISQKRTARSLTSRARAVAKGLHELGTEDAAANIRGISSDEDGLTNLFLTLDVFGGMYVAAVVGSGTGGSTSPGPTVRVGRWMSAEEFEAMRENGMVQESRTGTTHVALPADISAYEKQAAPGSVYVEFDVPVSSVKPTQAGWAKVVGPNSVEARLAAKKGLPIPQMPAATNVQHVANKLKVPPQ